MMVAAWISSSNGVFGVSSSFGSASVTGFSSTLIARSFSTLSFSALSFSAFSRSFSTRSFSFSAMLVSLDTLDFRDMLRFRNCLILVLIGASYRLPLFSLLGVDGREISWLAVDAVRSFFGTIKPSFLAVRVQ